MVTIGKNYLEESNEGRKKQARKEGDTERITEKKAQEDMWTSTDWALTASQ